MAPSAHVLTACFSDDGVPWGGACHGNFWRWGLLGGSRLLRGVFFPGPSALFLSFSGCHKARSSIPPQPSSLMLSWIAASQMTEQPRQLKPSSWHCYLRYCVRWSNKTEYCVVYGAFHNWLILCYLRHVFPASHSLVAVNWLRLHIAPEHILYLSSIVYYSIPFIFWMNIQVSNRKEVALVAAFWLYLYGNLTVPHYISYISSLQLGTARWPAFYDALFPLGKWKRNHRYYTWS